MNFVRFVKRLFFTFITLLRIGSYREVPRVLGFTRLNKNTHLGNNVNFNGFRVYGSGEIKIGNNFHSGSGCFVISQVHNYKGQKLPYDESYTTKKITIEDNVWFGMNVSILANCIVGEGAIVQAGSVIVGDIPRLAIVGGNPARVFKYRDSLHYEKLKNAKSFH